MGIIEIKRTEQDNWTSLIRIDKEANFVEKVVDPGVPLAKELFDREVFWLEKLLNTNIVPRLIGYNPVTLTIKMEWCGEVLTHGNKPTDVYEQLYNIHIILLQNHCFYNDWKVGNILVKEGKIKIIDFGWCPMIKEDFTCNSRIKSDLLEKHAGNYFQNIFKE